MRKGLVFMLFVLLFLLSSCKQVEYETSDFYINGEAIYRMKDNVCKVFIDEKVAEKEGKEYRIGTCTPPYYTVLIDGEYVDLIDYIKDNELDDDTIIESKIAQLYITDSYSTYLSIDLSRLELLSVSVSVNAKGKINTEGLQYHEERDGVPIEYAEIKDLVETLLNGEAGFEYSLYKEPATVSYGSFFEITVTLTDGSTEFVLQLSREIYGKMYSVSTSDSVQPFDATLSNKEVIKALYKYIEDQYYSMK